jgi:hypothetical protein
LSVQDLAMCNLSHGGLCHFDLHGGLKTPKMDVIPHKMGRGPRSHCTLEMMDVAFGGTWTPLGDDMIAPSTLTLAFGGPRRHLPSFDVMREARVCALDGSGRGMMWFEEGRCMT